MSILEELNSLLGPLGIPIETGVFTGKVPDAYIVLTPLADEYALHADNFPNSDIQEVRISIFTKGSYTQIKKQILSTLLNAEFTVTDRRYLGLDTETGYHGYSIDVQNNYEMED